MGTDFEDIQLDREDRKLIVDAAARAGKPWRQVLREALAQLAKPQDSPPLVARPTAEHETLLAKLERLGAIGMVKDTSSDLSTNKDHMRGFARDE